MKKTIVFLASWLIALNCYSQIKADAVLNKLSAFKDQYNKSFNKAAVKDKLILIYIPSGDEPFPKIYDKLKGKAAKPTIPIQFIGGFKEMAAQHSTISSGHLTEAYNARFGDTYFPILIDMAGETGELLKVSGLSVIILSKSKNKILSSQDFGYDRKKFFETINQYIK